MVRHFIVFQNVHEVCNSLFELSSSLCFFFLFIDCLFYDVGKLWDFSKFSVLKEELNHSILEQYVYSLRSFCFWTDIKTILTFIVKCLHDWFEWSNVKLKVFLFINIVYKVLVYSFYEFLVFSYYFLEVVLIDNLQRHLIVTPCCKI